MEYVWPTEFATETAVLIYTLPTGQENTNALSILNQNILFGALCTRNKLQRMSILEDIREKSFHIYPVVFQIHPVVLGRHPMT